MLRNLTSAAKVVYRHNLTFFENGGSALGKSLRCRFLSEVAEREPEPQLDKLYKKLEIEVRGNDPAVLESYGQYTSETARYLGIHLDKNFTPKKHHVERWTLLKSKHIYKKHRVQYEMRTYYRFLHFLRITGSTADTFLEYIQRNLPEGVAMKVTKVEIKQLPESVEQAVV